MITRTIENYLVNGCGRCELGGTPQCKVHQWTAEIDLIREIIINSGLNEEVKWGNPCYTLKNKNVVMIAVFKESCTLSFFKGALLKNDNGLLEKPGENTQAGRVIRFRSVDEITKSEPTLIDLLKQAIKLEQEGKKVEASTSLKYPEELIDAFHRNSALRKAFELLTPGRQRGYMIHFSQPKQCSTRTSRIEKCIPKIMAGKGFHDR